MTNSIAVLEDSYSEVVVNVIDLALNLQLFSDVGKPRICSETTKLCKRDVHEQYSRSCINCFCVECFCNCVLIYVNMNFVGVHSACVKLWGGGGFLFKAN